MSSRVIGDSRFRNTPRGSFSAGLNSRIFPRGEVTRKNCHPSHSSCAGVSGVWAWAGTALNARDAERRATWAVSGHPTESPRAAVAHTAQMSVHDLQRFFIQFPLSACDLRSVGLDGFLLLLGLRDHTLGDVGGNLVVVGKFDLKRPPAPGDRPEVRSVPEHLGHRHLRANDRGTIRPRLHPLDPGALAVQVA